MAMESDTVTFPVMTPGAIFLTDRYTSYVHAAGARTDGTGEIKNKNKNKDFAQNITIDT